MENNLNEEITQLGEKIKLKGFYKTVDRGSMIIIKKIIGNYLNKIEKIADIEDITLTLKIVHDSDNPEELKKYDIKSNAICNLGKFNADDVNDNLFSTLDNVLKKLEVQISKEKNKSKGN